MGDYKSILVLKKYILFINDMFCIIALVFLVTSVKIALVALSCQENSFLSLGYIYNILQYKSGSLLTYTMYHIYQPNLNFSGAISHAEWRDELKLAEVMKKAGGHWQFLGHNVGKHLFLKPEEALYLMEVVSILMTGDFILNPLIFCTMFSLK